MKKSTIILYWSFVALMVFLTLSFVLAKIYGAALGTGLAGLVVWLQLKNKKQEEKEEKND